MSDALTTNAHYDVLNAISLKQMAGSAAVSEATGLPIDDVEKVMADLTAAGLLFSAGGGALPTDASLPALAEVAAERYAAVRTDDAVLALLDRFEATNSQLLATMTRWQTLAVAGRQIPNDHADASYDAKVLQRVDRHVQQLDPLIRALAVHDGRFARYRERLGRALEAVDRGEREYVSSPVHDSVHTVWFEFHEDLLRTLGRQRAR